MTQMMRTCIVHPQAVHFQGYFIQFHTYQGFWSASGGHKIAAAVK